MSAEAVRLLTWQLSLPDGVDQPLSETAKRAGIKKTAFMRAKRELIAEGYVHEWRRQGADGRWSRPQLVSNVPLTADEAAAAVHGGRPTAEEPSVGEPTVRAVGRSQEKNEEKTSHPPHPLAERGAQALAAVAYFDEPPFSRRAAGHLRS
ncbi:hypothetical protein ACH427_16310 [Streptomyces sp. NPDC020379]|uniref:hypothetical protein n=1 Tax=Streptomyces sp. NPDC020379 TaxID=3365071 RepID=UPI0037B8A3CF